MNTQKTRSMIQILLSEANPEIMIISALWMPESCIMPNLKTMQAFTRPKIFIWSTLTMAQSTARNLVTRQLARSLGMVITSMSTFEI